MNLSRSAGHPFEAVVMLECWYPAANGALSTHGSRAQSVVTAIRAKLEATRARSNADSTLSGGPRSVPASSPPASERNGSSMYEPSHQGSGFGSS